MLLDERNCYIKDDTVILSVDVEADEAQVDKLSAVVHPMKRMLKQGLNSDVKLVCGGETIPAHRGILFAHSPVFCSMFAQEEMLESKEGVVRIEDANPDTVNISFLWKTIDLDSRDARLHLLW